MSFKQFFLLLCCCCCLTATGCRSRTETVGQSTSATTVQQSSNQTSAANSNGTATQNVAVNQNVSAQNSNTTTTQAAGKLDPCSLITSSEIASVQGEEVKEAKVSPGNSSRLAVSQCYYLTATPSKSVSLEVTQRLSGQPGALSPRDFWDESFERADSERAREGKREPEKEGARANEKEEKEGAPPRRITGVGEEAFWAGNVRVGALYVLKGNSIIRLSVGGVADQNERLERTKALAQLALKRLKD
jgi:hypothetical protein